MLKLEIGTILHKVFTCSIYTLAFCWNYYVLCILGANPAHSKANMVAWLNNLVTTYGGPDVMVTTVNGNKYPCWYHKLRSDQHGHIEGQLAKLDDWSMECRQNNLSAGVYFSVEVAGQGQCTIIHKPLGPFKSFM